MFSQVKRKIFWFSSSLPGGAFGGQTVKLKLKNEIKSLAHRGMMMQGVLQSQMMTEREAKIMCLEGEELYQALTTLHGNKLVEEVEFCLCRFSERLLHKMFQVLPTLEKIKRLKFVSCMYQGGRVIVAEDLQCSVTKIEFIEADNFFYMICNEKRDHKYWVPLRELDIDFRSRRSLSDEDLECAVFQGLKHLSQLADLKIKFEGCGQITDRGVNILAKGLSCLTQLIALSLNFYTCYQITKKGVDILVSQGIKYLSQLKSLNLNFGYCSGITDESFITLASNGLKYLPELASLTLGLFGCKVTDAGMGLLTFQGPKFLTLTQLTCLSLDFGLREEITDEGLNDLAPYLLNYTQLTTLSLGFSLCSQITDKGVSSLISQGLNKLTRMTSLTLNFKGCQGITNERVNSLASKWLKSLKSLTINCGTLQTTSDFDILVQREHGHNLNQRLRFVRENSNQKKLLFSPKELSNLVSENYNLDITSNEPEMENQPEHSLSQELVELLVSKAKENKRRTDIIDPTFKVPKKIFRKVENLASLFLDFRGHDDFITNQVMILASQALDHLTQLADLNLNFSECAKITNKGLKDFASKGLQHLKSLTSLTLNFSGCEKITDKGVMDLAKYGLKHLSEIRSLNLAFSACHKISDQGMIDLVIHGLQNLSQLTRLNLDFSDCTGITDEVFGGFVSRVLETLIQLKSLILHFCGCRQVMNTGLSELIFKEPLRLTSLTSLALNFLYTQITDQGLLNLGRNGFRNLPQLTSLNLSFCDCDQITDKGVHYLASEGLENLILLRSLILDFSLCPQITDKGVNHIIFGTKNLPQLIFINLNLEECPNVSGFTILNLAEILQYFGFKKEAE